MMSQYFLMNYSLLARIYPIVDFEVVGTLIYNGWFRFEEASKFAFIDLKKKKKKKKSKRRTD